MAHIRTGSALKASVLLLAAGCLVSDVAGPDILISIVDPARVIADDSTLPASLRAAVRVEMSRSQDALLETSRSGQRDIYGQLHHQALPPPGSHARVIIELPGGGSREFVLAHTTPYAGAHTYAGTSDTTARISLRRDSSSITGTLRIDGALYRIRSSNELLLLTPAGQPEACADGGSHDRPRCQ